MSEAIAKPAYDLARQAAKLTDERRAELGLDGSTVTIRTDGPGVYRNINASASPPGMPSPNTVHVPHSQVSEGETTSRWLTAKELTRQTKMAIEIAINDLFDAGGPDGDQLPAACYEDGPWQAPGTVAVRVEALRALAKAAGIAT